MNKSKNVSFPRLKKIVAGILCSKFVSWIVRKIYGDVIPSFGVRIRFPVGMSNTVRAAVFWRISESAEIRICRKYLKPDMDVVELGAGIGLVSSHIAEKLVEGRRLVCVEANEGIVGALRDNLDRNAQHLETFVENAAVAYQKDETVEFFQGSSHFSSSLEPGKGRVGIPTRSLRLSDVVSKYNMQSFGLVMDIEGAEIEILLLDKKALQGCEQIIAELHDTSFNGREFLVEDIIKIVKEEHLFNLVHRRGPVCFFEKGMDRGVSCG